jgi:mannosyltransferase OCH1-like enzyme
VNVYLK